MTALESYIIRLRQITDSYSLVNEKVCDEILSFADRLCPSLTDDIFN